MKSKRGYFGIGIYEPKTTENIGTLWRSAHNLGADFIFTIGKRYKHEASDTTKASRHVPLYHYEDFAEFNKLLPKGSELIAIEQSSNSISTTRFIHPERAVYLLGAEDYGVPDKYLKKCKATVHIDSPRCLNVAVAGSIIMYDRLIKV